MRSNIRLVWLITFLVLVSVSLAEDDPFPDYVSGRVGSPRLRHGRSVTALRFSKDGKKLFSSSADFTVRMWEVATGKELRTFATDTSKITDLVLSADEKRLLMATPRGGVLVWDVESGKQIKQLGDKPVDTIAITPDGKTVFSASGDGVWSWDLESGEENAKVVSAKTAITRLTVSSNGDWLAGTSGGGKVLLWNCKTGELQHILKSERNAPNVPAVAFSPDGSVVAAPGLKGSILVWNVKTGKLQNKLAWEGKTSMWRSLAFSADGKTIFAGNTTGDLGALNWKEVKQEFSVKRHTGVIGCIAVSPDGHTVATGGGRWRQNWDHQIRLWNAKTGDELPQSRRHGGHLPSVVAMTPDGKRIVLGNWNRCFSVWDVEKNLPLHEFTRPGAYSRVTVALSPDGNVVATGGEPVLRLWNMATGALWNLSSNSKRPSGMKFTPDGKRLVAGTGDGHLMVWDVAQRKLLADVRAHDGEIWSLDVSHDGKLIATCSFDGSVALWATDTLKPYFKHKAHGALGRCVRFSGDAMRIASGSGDHQVIVWETTTGEIVRKFDTRWSVTSLSFCRRGRVVISGHHHDRLHFWDVATGARIHTFRSRPGPYTNSLVCRADGRTMLTAGSDGVVRLWDLPEMLKKVPALKNVELSEEELNAVWQSLAGKDAAIANDAAWKLATGGEPALKLMKERLDPAQLPKSDVDNIRRLIRELDDDKFLVREAAWKALNNEGPAALPLLEAALKQAASAEVRFRVRSLIKRLSGQGSVASLSPEELQAGRAIQILGYLNTPATRQLLEAIAKGNRARFQSRQAKAVLDNQRP